MSSNHCVCKWGAEPLQPHPTLYSKTRKLTSNETRPSLMASRPSSLFGTSHNNLVLSLCWQEVACKSASQKFTKAACHPIITNGGRCPPPPPQPPAQADTKRNPTLIDGNHTSRTSLGAFLQTFQKFTRAACHPIRMFPQFPFRPCNSKPQAFGRKHARITFPGTKTKKYGKRTGGPQKTIGTACPNSLPSTKTKKWWLLPMCGCFAPPTVP